MTGPHWTQVLTALLTPVLAVLGLLIAYWQWRISRNKLKLDLFEKRFAVYNAARNLISSILTRGKVEDEELYKFLSGTLESKWLLNDDIATYFDKFILKNATELQTLEFELGVLPIGDERAKNARRQNEIKTWFASQYRVLDEKFLPFLKIHF